MDSSSPSQAQGPQNDEPIRSITLALFAIGSFATIFVVGILWATRRNTEDHSSH